MVITRASHARGPEFDPRFEHLFFYLLVVLFVEKKIIFEARIELATSSVLDWRDNQLHHPNFLSKNIMLAPKIHPVGIEPTPTKLTRT